MTESIVISGFGGQGVMFMGKLLAYAGMLAGKEVSWIPSYGPEMRGGTANCSVIISDEEIGCPVVNKPTIIVAMNGPSLDKFLPILVPGGLVVVNSSIVSQPVDRSDVRVLKVPANELGHQLGKDSIGNVVVTGALVAGMDILTRADIMAALDEMVGAKKPQMMEINKAAIECGLNLVK